MTDGTSQGLFIVVAIVIFGLFVSLSYTLFGSQGISKDLEMLFTNATEQVTSNNENLIKKSNLFDWMVKIPNETIKILSNSEVILGANGDLSTGLGIGAKDILEENKNYSLKFKVTRISGEISYLGGHIHFSTDTQVSLNGKHLDNSGYKKGNAFLHGFEIIEDVNVVEVLFNTNTYDTDVYKDLEVNPNPIHIQPNRLYSQDGKTITGFKRGYVAKISEIKLLEIK